ncbi:6-phospho-3-hexuloisomerase [Herbiconiux sp. L3-i23]|nr:6-phospho-3-hexuloisomerase [Herbiconiux sp. L3-i23]
MSAYARSNVEELAAVVAELDDAALDALVDAIVAAPRVYFTGIGRSGLSARAIAMRLMHIGIHAFVVGEVATPGIGAGDLLVAFTSSGRGSVQAQADVASSVGAWIATFTTKENELTARSVASVILPARTVVATQQHAGSLFEQACLVVGDAICRAVQERLGVPTEELDRRHANLQ